MTGYLRPTRPDTLVVWQVAVDHSHRGRGLARWVKAESLRLLAQDRPDVALVSTCNAEENAAIRRVNERLGFVPVATHTTCELRL